MKPASNVRATICFSGGSDNEKIVDDARLVRVRAAEFERCRGAIGFRIAAVDGDVGRDLVGQADDRIDPVEIVVGIEIGVRAGLVGERDLGVVEARADVEAQSVRDVEIVENINAEIGILRVEADRRNAVRDIVDISARIALNDEVRRQRAQLTVADEMRPAVVDADAAGDGVVMAEDLVGVGQLCRRAGAQRMSPVAVDLAHRLTVGQCRIWVGNAGDGTAIAEIAGACGCNGNSC